MLLATMEEKEVLRLGVSVAAVSAWRNARTNPKTLILSLFGE